jgi:hypothetical protein
VNSNGLEPQLHSFFRLALFGVDQRQIGIRDARQGIQLHRLLVQFDGLVEALLVVTQRGKPHVRTRVIRVQRDRTTKCRLGFQIFGSQTCVAPNRRFHQSENGIRIRKVRVQFKRTVDARLCRCQGFGLRQVLVVDQQQHDAFSQARVRLGVLRIQRNRFLKLISRHANGFKATFVQIVLGLGEQPVRPQITGRHHRHAHLFIR